MLSLLEALLALLGLLTGWLLYRAVVMPQVTPLRHVPGPKYGFLLGAFPEIAKSEPCVPQLAWARQYGGLVYYTRVLGSPAVLVSDPLALKRVLVEAEELYPKPRIQTRVMRDSVGLSLLTSEGEVHAKQRALLNPHFHFENLKSIFPVFVSRALMLRDQWAKLGVNKEVDMHAQMTQLTLDIIGLSAFGVDFDATSGRVSALTDAFNKLLPGFSIALFLRQYISASKHLPLKVNRDQAEGVATVRAKVNEIVASKLASPEHSGVHTTLLDWMIHGSYKDGSKMTTEELTDQVLTFLVAGHETTSNALCWAWYLLSQNPQVEAELHRELMTVLPDEASMQSLNADTLAQLPYLWAVCNESLRLRPPAPLTSRVCLGDTLTLSTGESYEIPKGTNVFISPLVVHRLEQFWPEPEAFRPERWFKDGDRTARKHPAPYTFLPFLYGSRSCIGQRFAMIEFQIVLAILARSFTARLVPGVDVQTKLRITMRPYPALRMTLQPTVPADDK